MPSIVLSSRCHSSSESERLHPDSSLKISWIHAVEILSQIYSWLLEPGTKKEHSRECLDPTLGRWLGSYMAPIQRAGFWQCESEQ